MLELPMVDRDVALVRDFLEAQLKAILLNTSTTTQTQR